MTKEEIQNLMKKVDPAIIAKADKVIKAYVKKQTGTQLPETGRGVSPQAEAAMKAVVRILTPFKDEINDALLDDVLVGAGVLSAGEPGGAMKGFEKPDDMDQETHDKAVKHAESMYKAAVHKLGYRKYPDAEMELKQAGYVSKDGGDLPPKADSHVYKDAITKEDGSLNEEALKNMSPEVRNSVTQLWKQNKEAITKSAKIEADLKTERDERRKKEFVAKADGFKHFTGDKAGLAQQLMELSDANPKLYESTVKNLELVEKQSELVAQGMFRELGTELPMPSGVAGQTGEAAWTQIEKAAEGHVAKTGEKVSKEQAIEKFLLTKEGQQMYRDYKAGRPAGI